MSSEEKTVPVTVRLDIKCLTALRKKAHGKQSFNSLVHEILDRYVEHYQHFERFEPLVLTKSSFRTLLSMLNQKQCAEFAANVAKKEASEFIQFRWGKIDIDTIIAFLRMFFEYCGYGQFTEESDDDFIIFKVRHGMSKNGSFYIKSLIVALMDNASLPKPEFVLTHEGLIIKIHK